MFQIKHSPAQTYAAPVEEISPSCNNFFLKCELFHIYHFFFNAAPNKVLTFQLIVGIIYLVRKPFCKSNVSYPLKRALTCAC